MIISIYSTMVLDTPPSGYGGLENIAYLLARYLTEQNHTVYLFATADSYEPRPGHLFACGKAGVNPVQSWKAFWDDSKSKNALKESDIVCDMSWNYYPYSVYNDLKNLCHVIHAPDPGFQTRPPVEKPNLMGVGFHQSKLLSRYTNLEVRTVQNGIELEKYEYNPKPISERERLLWISRIYRPKGTHRAIEIANELKMPIDIVGGSFGDQRDYVDMIKDMCNKSSYATFHGEVSFEKKLEFYKNAKCVILPIEEKNILANGTEWYWNEPWGLIPQEANASGSPIIVSPNGGFMESMLHGINGFFANSNREFKYFIKQVDTLSPKNCRNIAERFDYRVMGENYLRLFEEIISGVSW